MSNFPWINRKTGRRVQLGLPAAFILAYLGLAGYQLGLPGLHYDEAKEAGLNALELLRGHPVTAFRGATLDLAGWSLPLMVQDYIGALNVYLVAPFLALSGIGVPNVRWPAVFIGVATLILLERTISEWWRWQVVDADFTGSDAPRPAGGFLAGGTLAGVLGVALLALAPSFVFWSRQGIFVTNLTQPLCLLAVWQGIRWLRAGRPTAFLLMGWSAGLAIYAKLLAGWVLGPFALIGLASFVLLRRQRRGPVLTTQLLAGGLGALVVGLAPLLLFNLQTGGTWIQLTANLGESYYGVDNRAWGENFAVRMAQLGLLLRGDHLWYLGGVFANPVAPWVAVVGVAAVVVWPRLVGLPLLLVAGAVAMSGFTISDLFITHYALLHPFGVGAVAIGLAAWLEWARSRRASARGGWAVWAVGAMIAVGALGWAGGDLYTSLRYHGALAQSGGYADHSDATYHFAYHLRYNGMGAPIALDWGMDAPVRFLTENAVRPIEIFGYDSPVVPDVDFVRRLAPFLENPDNVYLLRDPQQTVFAGRRELFFEEADRLQKQAILLETFAQRNGAPLFEIWRVE